MAVVPEARAIGPADLGKGCRGRRTKAPRDWTSRRGSSGRRWRTRVCGACREPVRLTSDERMARPSESLALRFTPDDAIENCTWAPVDGPIASRTSSDPSAEGERYSTARRLDRHVHVSTGTYTSPRTRRSARLRLSLESDSAPSSLPPRSETQERLSLPMLLRKSLVLLHTRHLPPVPRIVPALSQPLPELCSAAQTTIAIDD
ncbi:hypothetical protein C8F01DRAFT_319313 [Mycena amicta]|nr:hypothetical protein C8F01DRAFT_319313 [Mycena amicta]